ncbi:MAG: hypothetical protein AAF170_15375, partial [Bacteroidota bacterium]
MNRLLLILFVLSVCAADAVEAQERPDLWSFFRHEVGDRWVYRVEGVAWPDTLQATVEWEFKGHFGVGQEAEMRYAVERTLDSGEVESGLCGIRAPFDNYLAPYPSRDPLCRSGGGFPFSIDTYPFLYPTDSSRVDTFHASGVEYVDTLYGARFSYFYHFDPRDLGEYESAEVEAIFVEGLGQVKMRSLSGYVEVRAGQLRSLRYEG